MKFIVQTSKWQTKARRYFNLAVEAANMEIWKIESDTVLAFWNEQNKIVALFREWDSAWAEGVLEPLQSVVLPHEESDAA